jgi:Leucine-rich repeat (LRR) protein
MENNKKILSFVFVIVFVVLIAAFIYFGFLKKKTQEEQAVLPETNLVEERKSFCLGDKEHPFTDLKEAQKNPESVCWLDLNNANLGSLPGDIDKFKNLVELYASGNGLKELPDGLNKLSRLRLLDLSNNSIFSLPEDIGGLSSLVTLKLTNNNLKSLPSSIGELKNLSELYLNVNSLSSLPDEFWTLSSLTRLDLANNNLSSAISEKISGLKKLNTLYIYKNNLPKGEGERIKLLFAGIDIVY